MADEVNQARSGVACSCRPEPLDHTRRRRRRVAA